MTRQCREDYHWHVLPGSELVNALAPRSYLAMSQRASDARGEELAETFSRLSQEMVESAVLRTREKAAVFFDDRCLSIRVWRNCRMMTGLRTPV